MQAGSIVHTCCNNGACQPKNDKPPTRSPDRGGPEGQQFGDPQPGREVYSNRPPINQSTPQSNSQPTPQQSGQATAAAPQQASTAAPTTTAPTTAAQTTTAAPTTTAPTTAAPQATIAAPQQATAAPTTAAPTTAAPTTAAPQQATAAPTTAAPTTAAPTTAAPQQAATAAPTAAPQQAATAQQSVTITAPQQNVSSNIQMPLSQEVSVSTSHTLSLNNQSLPSTVSSNSSPQQSISNMVNTLPSTPTVQAAVTKLEIMATNPQMAQVAESIASSISEVASNNPQAATSIASSVSQIPTSNMPAFATLVATLPTLNVPPQGMVMLASVVANTVGSLSAQATTTLANSLQVTQPLTADIGKLASLQAVLNTSGNLDPSKLAELLGPILLNDSGLDENEKMKKKEQRQALDRMVQFLDTYVSTGHAMWADNMHHKKEQEAMLNEHKKATRQLKQQIDQFENSQEDRNGNVSDFNAFASLKRERELVPA